MLTYVVRHVTAPAHTPPMPLVSDQPQRACWMRPSEWERGLSAPAQWETSLSASLETIGEPVKKGENMAATISLQGQYTERDKLG